jgi:membrane protein implicated in regulation of membrane protease activity
MQKEGAMVLADFGVAFVIVTGLAVVLAVVARGVYQRRHPPLTTQQKTGQLEQELTDINRKIEEIEKWDT